MNATVIMVSQGATALGGLIWGSSAAAAGTTVTLLGAATLFAASLLLVSQFSINLTRNLEETVSGFLSGTVPSIECARVNSCSHALRSKG